MPTPFSFRRYLLKNQQDESVMDVDFGQPVKIPQKLLSQVLNDLSNFAGHVIAGHSSQLELDHEGEQLVIKKDHDSKQLTSASAEKLTKLEPSLQQSAVVFVPQEATAQMAADYRQKLAPEQEEQAADIGKLEAEFIQLSGEVGQKLAEAEQKLKSVEVELAEQRKADDSQLAIGQLETQVKDVEQKLATVDKLIDKQTALTQELAKIQSSTGTFSEDQVVLWREQIRQIREDQFTAMAGDKANFLAAQSDEKKDTKMQQYSLVEPALFWGMVIVLLVVGAIGYFVSQNALVPITATAGSILILFIYHSANRIPRELNLAVIKQQTKSAEAGSNAPATFAKTTAMGVNVDDLEQKFLQKAWLEVYQQELVSMEETIKDKLEGDDHDQLTSLINDIRLEIADLQEVVAAQKQQELTPDKYLAKRREVDMLKVEKARLETDLRGLENFNQINELRTQLELLKANAGEKAELEALVQQINSLQNTDLHLAALYAVEYWLNAEVAGPLVLVDWDKTIARVVRTKISDRINKHKSDVAQVIFINTTI